MYDEVAKMPEQDFNRMAGGSIGGAGLSRDREQSAMQCERERMACGSAENMRSRAMRRVQEAASDAARHKRLAEKLTPEIETILWCWQEAMALGLIDGRILADNINQLERSGRDRF